MSERAFDKSSGCDGAAPLSSALQDIFRTADELLILPAAPHLHLHRRHTTASSSSSSSNVPAAVAATLAADVMMSLLTSRRQMSELAAGTAQLADDLLKCSVKCHLALQSQPELDLLHPRTS